MVVGGQMPGRKREEKKKRKRKRGSRKGKAAEQNPDQRLFSFFARPPESHQTQTQTCPLPGIEQMRRAPGVNQLSQSGPMCSRAAGRKKISGGGFASAVAGAAADDMAAAGQRTSPAQTVLATHLRPPRSCSYMYFFLSAPYSGWDSATIRA